MINQYQKSSCEMLCKVLNLPNLPLLATRRHLLRVHFVRPDLYSNFWCARIGKGILLSIARA